MDRWLVNALSANLARPASSSDSDYVVMAIYGGFERLTFLKPGDKAWTSCDPKYIFIAFDSGKIIEIAEVQFLPPL
ncbi:hypothetical protein FRX31_027493 [Thalictrum thalictroides]|uniref:Uncharacterized protein n=1 Tax=Thalictrum thalictroides TaxID=46969 RepID=A0A7J6VFC6_THATH|nr:hypothetical protein FRX31_027493 [Thalictrum thalictroides]